MGVVVGPDAGNADVTFAGEKGEFVAAGSDEGSVLLWHTNKPAKEGTDIALSEHDDIVSAVAAHQTHLLSASWDHKYAPTSSTSSTSTQPSLYARLTTSPRPAPPHTSLYSGSSSGTSPRATRSPRSRVPRHRRSFTALTHPARCVSSLKSGLLSSSPTAHIGAVNTVEFINAALFVSGAQVRVQPLVDKMEPLSPPPPS